MSKNPTLARVSMSIALHTAASRRVPIDVELVMEHLEPAVLEIEAYANEQLDEIRARIDALKDQLRAKERECVDLEKLRRRAEADAVAASMAVGRSPLGNPRGFYVYFLWGDDDLLLYVGKSTNLLGRLGSHLGDPEKRRWIVRITMNEYPNDQAMSRAEGRAIYELRPLWNIQGARDDDAA